jgi:hypothetical protein
MVMSKLVWKCQQAFCTLSSSNKIIFLQLPGHCGIQGNEDALALTREGLSSSFLGSETAILILPCVAGSRLMDG